jgi:hypothetical protein
VVYEGQYPNISVSGGTRRRFVRATEELEYVSWQGQEGFLFSKEYRADRGAHELSVLWYRGLLRLELKSDKISPYIFEVKNA